uniref:Tetratricopeptide repeat domain 3 n=1 Tax=Sander lucioperca TaxID=283035 RepID=A0A8D0D818_SANLU
PSRNSLCCSQAKLSVFSACFCFLEEVFERWSRIAVDIRRDAGERMRVCAFWLPILLQWEESSITACWASEIGLINSNEEMKKKGNEFFQKKQYEDAVKFYSKAIKYYPDNHIIYGNRTFNDCFCLQGHYRYCEALFSLGEFRKAIEANISAQSLCRDNHEGIKDLEQQQQKFFTEMPEPKGIFTNQKLDDSKADVCEELRSLVRDGHTALADLRSHNAEQAFRKALAILATSSPKHFTLSTLEAQTLLEKIKSFEERTFQCLVYYAIGRVHLKENRFAVALRQFSDSLQMVKNQIIPGKLTWPLTKEIVKETQPDYFKDILEQAIEFCRFPPNPDAICRLEKCLGHLKAEIYFTDPDFKGFIQICCCRSCIVEYHIACWKALKSSSFCEKNEKDFLQEPCLTPDCVGQICCIKIFGPTGLVKCKAAVSLLEPQVYFVLAKQMISHLFVFTVLSAWLLYRDRVLLQISQNMELLREEKGLHVSALTSSLKPWLELDSSRGNQVAARILNWQLEPLENLGQAVELLLERKNRVWARVLIQLLSTCQDINPKLNNWACQLNNAGLNAAKSFIERYAGHLEQLDLAFLLNFGPLQDVIIEKLGTRPELFSSIGLTVTEYLKQAPPRDMRLFIWTLEEHRDGYLSCHPILDEYFDMMDGHCSVLKKFAVNRSFLHPSDPFSVPSHLREQVAEFENQYNGTRHRSHYKNILDNNPDPTKESLYDYFAQILEEHGPLVAEDPLLVGELGNFPSVAQLKMKEAGGFEPFLLESLRFIKMGRCIGLAKHAVTLQQAGHGASLDDLDEIHSDSPSPDFEAGQESALMGYLDAFSSAETAVTNKELTLFQQKLEEEVKKDQKEKKANQEGLKSLKLEIEELLNVEDPCIICHEDMSPDDICVLVCRHSFHDECIRSWLKEQSTCPTCREHALLHDDFPALSARRRQAP